MRQIRNQAAALAALALLASCSSDDSPAGTEPSPTGAGSTTSTTPDPGYTVVADDSPVRAWPLGHASAAATPRRRWP